MSFFNSLVQRVGYGAIMYNGSAGGISSCYPFFTSCSNMVLLKSVSSSGAGTISIADVDDYWTVMPGYKIILYNDINYTSTAVTYDNTSGVVPVNYTPTANTVASVQLYFNNTLIAEPPLTYDTPSNSITVSNFANTYNVTYNSVNYRVYEFYTGSTGTLSFSGSSTVSNIQCLLIGGGGSGAQNSAYQVGIGGGGAGAFLTTTIPVVAGDTFTVNVGDGGVAPTGGRPGNYGASSSIQRTTGGQTYTLTAGGGGGGGGGVGVADNYEGLIGNPWGSTGGACPWTINVDARATSSSNAFTQTGAVFGTVTASVFKGGYASRIYTASPVHEAAASGAGGAGGVGSNNSATVGGNGGPGKAWFLNGVTYAGGGGGGGAYGADGAGGSGGGGTRATPGTPNTGSGGGSAVNDAAGAGKGGSGICIFAIPF